MPGTVQQLKEKLMGAIDTEANVSSFGTVRNPVYSKY